MVRKKKPGKKGKPKGRSPVPPPTIPFKDRKKEADRKACRGPDAAVEDDDGENGSSRDSQGKKVWYLPPDIPWMPSKEKGAEMLDFA